MPDTEYYDHSETFDQVLKGLIEKVGKVCRAFKMPFIIAIQTQYSEHKDESRGQMFTPSHTMNTIGLAGFLATAKSDEEMKARIMKIAATIAMSEMRDMRLQEVRHMFSELVDDTNDKEEDDNKRLN